MFNVKDADFFELDEEDFDTILATDISFSGTIKFIKPFMIKGTVNGTIEATSDLVIDSQATVRADIKASRVLVKGHVDGNIVADDMVFVSAQGAVKGDITAAQVVLEPGSTFSGRCSMISRSYQKNG